jgi:hypothetical protein
MVRESIIDTMVRLATDLDDGQGKGIGPNNVPLHMPPMDKRPIGVPAIIISLPDIIDYAGTVGGCPHYDMRVELLVVAESTVGVDLPGTVDAVLAMLDNGHYKVTGGSPTTWQPPDTPSPLPAYALTVE